MIISVSGKIGSGKDTVGDIIQYLVVDEFRNQYRKNIITYEDWKGLHSIEKNRYSQFQIRKFADKLKDIICILINCTREQLEDHEFKNTELGEEWTNYAYADGHNDHYRNGEWTKSMNSVPCSKERYEEEYRTNWQTAYKSVMTPRLLLQLLGTQCGRDIIHPSIWINSLFSTYNGDIERWVDIKGYETSYQISDFGRVKRKERISKYGDNKGQYHTYEDLILKPTLSGKYLTVKLLNEQTFTVHSLVGNHFCEKIEGKTYLNHIDQDSLNNFYRNIEWCTQSENILSANLNGTGNIGEKQADSKLTEKDVLEIKQLLKTNISQKTIGIKYNVSPTTICDIKKERKWKHVGKEIIKQKPIIPILLPNWIITDTRFPNELKAVKDKGGISIRINRVFNKPFVNPSGITIQSVRDLSESDKHESETALDNAEFDYVIENNSTIEDLIDQVKEILIKEQIIK